jgi:hypothetical protein
LAINLNKVNLRSTLDSSHFVPLQDISITNTFKPHLTFYRSYFKKITEHIYLLQKGDMSCINCIHEVAVLPCLQCSRKHYCCAICKDLYEERMDSFLCPNQYLPVVEQTRSGSYSLPALPQSTVSRNLRPIGSTINLYRQRQGSSTQLPTPSGHLNQPSSGSFTLPTLVQSTVNINQPRTSGSTQFPPLIAPRINSSSPTLTNRIQRLPVPGSIRLPPLVTETSQQELQELQVRLEEAMELFNSEKYVESLNLLEQIKSELSNHEGSTSRVLILTIKSYIERINLLTISH